MQNAEQFESRSWSRRGPCSSTALKKHFAYWVPPVPSGSRRLRWSRSFPTASRSSALAAGNNIDILEKQVRQFRPALVSVVSPAAAEKLKQRCADLHVTHPLRRRGHDPGRGGGRSGHHRLRHCRDRRAGADHGGDPGGQDDRAGEQGSAGDRGRTGHGRVPEPGRQAPSGGQRAQRHLPVPARRREPGHPEADPDRLGRSLQDASQKRTSRR